MARPPQPTGFYSPNCIWCNVKLVRKQEYKLNYNLPTSLQSLKIVSFFIKIHGWRIILKKICIKYRRSKIVVRIVVLIGDVHRRYMWGLEIGYMFEYTNTDIRRLPTRIPSEKCVVRWFRRYANVIECTYTNLDSIACHRPMLYGIAYCSYATNLYSMLLYWIL